ncbi:MAG: hypothetical protein RSD36_11030 [Terrisporobacter sp.]
MQKVMKYGYVFVLAIFIIIGILIGFAIKQGESKLTPVEIKNNEVTIMNNTYSIDDIVKVELLSEVNLSGGSGLNRGRYRNYKKDKLDIKLLGYPFFEEN